MRRVVVGEGGGRGGYERSIIKECEYYIRDPTYNRRVNAVVPTPPIILTIPPHAVIIAPRNEGLSKLMADSGELLVSDAAAKSLTYTEAVETKEEYRARVWRDVRVNCSVGRCCGRRGLLLMFPKTVVVVVVVVVVDMVPVVLLC